VKPPAKIGTPGSSQMLATARTPSTAGILAKTVKVATACMLGGQQQQRQ